MGTRTDFVVLFPLEISFEVFKFLTIRELVVAESTCVTWREVISSDLFWRGLYKKRYKIRNSHPKSWRNEYKHQFLRTLQNRLKGHYTTKQLSLNSPKPIITFQIDENKIIYGQDNHLFESPFPTNKLNVSKTWTLPRSNDHVTCLQYDDKILVSGTQLGDVVIWSLDGYSTSPVAVLSTPNDQESNIQTLQFDDEHICVAKGNTLQVWSLEQKQLLRSHNSLSTILCLQFDNNKIVAGTSAGTLHAWNIRSGSGLYTHSLSSIEFKINCLQFEDDEKVYVGVSDGRVVSVDARTGAILETYTTEHRQNGVVKIYIESGDGFVVAAHEDGVVVVWSRAKREVLSLLQGHGREVTCMQCEKSMIVASSEDVACGLIVWDYTRQDDMFGADMLELDFTIV